MNPILREYTRQLALSFKFNLAEGKAWARLSRQSYYVAVVILALVVVGCLYALYDNARFPNFVVVGAMTLLGGSIIALPLLVIRLTFMRGSQVKVKPEFTLSEELIEKLENEPKRDSGAEQLGQRIATLNLPTSASSPSKRPKINAARHATDTIEQHNSVPPPADTLNSKPDRPLS